MNRVTASTRFTTRLFRQNRHLLIALALLLSAAQPLTAKEGSDQYPNGAESWMVGELPPPGTYFINYFGYYTGQLKNGSGNKVLLNGTTPTVDATFDALRFVQVTKFKIAGADYGMHIIVPIVYQSMNLNGARSTTGIGNIDIDPFVLGWNRTYWHAVTGLDIYLPTGHYSTADVRACIGTNYTTFEPVLALSYLPKSGWEGSVKLMYDFNTTNQLTNYHSGQEFHMDYLAGKHLGSWMFGASGYAIKQVTNDTVNGQIVPAVPGWWNAGREGQALAIGPSVGYTNKHQMTFLAQWQHEVLVANRFGGDKIWFKMVIPFASLRHL
jgi:hypothetical protein